jgi:septal ring factor EnvC (AmiA/AmiB activator)
MTMRRRNWLKTLTLVALFGLIGLTAGAAAPERSGFTWDELKAVQATERAETMKAQSEQLQELLERQDKETMPQPQLATDYVTCVQAIKELHQQKADERKEIAKTFAEERVALAKTHAQEREAFLATLGGKKGADTATTPPKRGGDETADHSPEGQPSDRSQ